VSRVSRASRVGHGVERDEGGKGARGLEGGIVLLSPQLMTLPCSLTGCVTRRFVDPNGDSDGDSDGDGDDDDDRGLWDQ
jgi:hypothetical protein